SDAGTVTRTSNPSGVGMMWPLATTVVVNAPKKAHTTTIAQTSSTASSASQLPSPVMAIAWSSSSGDANRCSEVLRKIWRSVATRGCVLLRGPLCCEVMSTSEIPVYSRRHELPLSYSELMMAQRALNDPSLGAHNGFLANLLIGPLDRDALTASLSELAQRQEILRTGFVLRDGQLIRAIGDAMPPPLDVIDLQSLDSDARDAEAQRRSEAEMRRAFDLTQRMMRATLFILAPERHVLVLTLHHAIADAWSLAIVAQELTRLYGQHAHGEPANLPPLRIQYADYAAWKHGQLVGDRLADLTARWTRRLQNPPPPLDLPPITDSRDGKQSADSEGASRTFALDAALVEQVRRCSRRHRVTPFTTLLAAFAGMLALMTRQHDLVVVVPVSDRSSRDLQ